MSRDGNDDARRRSMKVKAVVLPSGWELTVNPSFSLCCDSIVPSGLRLRCDGRVLSCECLPKPSNQIKGQAVTSHFIMVRQLDATRTQRERRKVD